MGAVSQVAPTGCFLPIFKKNLRLLPCQDWVAIGHSENGQTIGWVAVLSDLLREWVALLHAGNGLPWICLNQWKGCMHGFESNAKKSAVAFRFPSLFLQVASRSDTPGGGGGGALLNHGWINKAANGQSFYFFFYRVFDKHCAFLPAPCIIPVHSSAGCYIENISC